MKKHSPIADIILLLVSLIALLAMDYAALFVLHDLFALLLTPMLTMIAVVAALEIVRISSIVIRHQVKVAHQKA